MSTIRVGARQILCPFGKSFTFTYRDIDTVLTLTRQPVERPEARSTPSSATLALSHVFVRATATEILGAPECSTAFAIASATT
jgi:hypothetical protein